MGGRMEEKKRGEAVAGGEEGRGGGREGGEKRGEEGRGG